MGVVLRIGKRPAFWVRISTGVTAVATALWSARAGETSTWDQVSDPAFITAFIAWLGAELFFDDSKVANETNSPTQHDLALALRVFEGVSHHDLHFIRTYDFGGAVSWSDIRFLHRLDVDFEDVRGEFDDPEVNEKFQIARHCARKSYCHIVDNASINENNFLFLASPNKELDRDAHIRVQTANRNAEEFLNKYAEFERLARRCLGVVPPSHSL